MLKLATSIAPVLLLAGACGKVDVHHLPDGPVGPDVDADPRGGIDITTYDANGPHVPTGGVAIIVVEPDSTTTRLATADDGTLHTKILPNSVISAVWVTGPNNYSVETIVGAKPGDKLAFTATYRDYTTTNQFTMTAPTMAGATGYRFITPCGESSSTTSSATVYMYRYCDKTPMSIAAEPYDSAGNTLGLLTMDNVTPTLLGTVSLSGAYNNPGSFSAQLTNLDPATEAYVTLDRYPVGPGFSEGPISGGGAPTGTTMSLSLSAAVSSSAVVETFVQAPFAGAGQRQQQLYQGVNGSTLSFNQDVGTKLLPWLDIPTIDPATGTVSTTLPAGTAIDAGAVGFQLSKAGSGSGSSALPPSYITWWVVTPDVSTPFKLPALPMEVGTLDPTSMDSIQVTNLTVVESSGLTYDDLRGDFYGWMLTHPFVLTANDPLLRVETVNNFID